MIKDKIVNTTKKGERMPMDADNFYRVIGMRDELIFEMKDEISALKMKINRLEQKLNRG